MERLSRLFKTKIDMEEEYKTLDEIMDLDGIYLKKDKYMPEGSEVLVLLIDGIGYELGPPMIFSSDNTFKIENRLYERE